MSTRLSICKNTGTDSASLAYEQILLDLYNDSRESSQNDAYNIKVVSKINGEKTLTFDILYSYVDYISGETVTNPLASKIINETKLFLTGDDLSVYSRDGETANFDFIVKSTQLDNEKRVLSVTANDYYINELSRNGYDISLSQELNNNQGTAEELLSYVFNGTDWTIDSTVNEHITQTIDENLLSFTLTQNISVYRIDTTDKTQLPVISSSQYTITNGSTIYVPYSQVTSQPYRFVFFYKNNAFNIDSNKVITDTDCQYFIDAPVYVADSGSSGDITVHNYYYPNFVDSTSQQLSLAYIGRRVVYSVPSTYNSLLDNYCNIYTKDGNTYLCNEVYDTTAVGSIKSYVTNGDNPTSTGGWREGTLTNGGATPTIQVVELDTSTKTTQLDDLRSGSTSGTYSAYLKCVYPSSYTNAIVVNSGIIDNRKAINNLLNGDAYILLIKGYSDTRATLTIKLREMSYDPLTKQYTPAGDALWSTTISPAVDTTTGFNYYYNHYSFASISNADYTEKEFSKAKIYFTIESSTAATIYFESMQFSPLSVSDGDETVILTRDLSIQCQSIGGIYQSKGLIVEYEPAEGESSYQYLTATTTKWYKYYKASYNSTTHTYDLYGRDGNTETIVTDKELLLSPIESTEEPLRDGYSANLTAEKISSITISASNYYNIIQSICESFGCWIEVRPQYTTSGMPAVTNNKRKLVIHASIVNDNYLGFRYGSNLKSITRDLKSDSLVTRMIVKQNNNKNASNEFCTISRATSNYIKDNCIYNFDYYIHNGLIDYSILTTALYGAQGLYTLLHRYNTELDIINNDLTELQLALISWQGKLTVAETGVTSSSDLLDTINDEFLSLFGYAYADVTSHQSDFNSKTASANEYQSKALQLMETQQEYDKYTASVIALTPIVNDYKTNIADAQTRINTLTASKKAVICAFDAKFSRYVQEGTWSSDDYYDDELYYLDAQAALYNSCKPSVEYKILVIDLSALPQYSFCKFGLGDRTYVEDTEMFGYDSSGNPYREWVTITEIEKNIDSPENNNITVENVTNSFQDLFKKIEATVQSVSSAKGGYDNATELTTNTAAQSDMLNNAFNTTDEINIYNPGSDAVKWTKEGLLIQNPNNQNQILRILGNGFLASTDGGESWSSVLSSDGGISANKIKTGFIDTKKLVITNDTEHTTFLWNSAGLTAYDYDTTGDIKNGAIRFDRFGLYGFDNSNSFIPSTIDDVVNNSEFSLTWRGLKIKRSGNVYCIIGDHNDFFGTNEDSLVIGAGEAGNAKFAVYANGHVKMKSAQIGGWSLSSNLYSGYDLKTGDVNSGLGTYSSPYIPSNNYLALITGTPYYKLSSTAYEVNSNNWRFIVGKNFGVQSDGTLMAKNANISGVINASADSRFGDTVTFRTTTGNEGLILGNVGLQEYLSGSVASKTLTISPSVVSLTTSNNSTQITIWSTFVDSNNTSYTPSEQKSWSFTLTAENSEITRSISINITNNTNLSYTSYSVKLGGTFAINDISFSNCSSQSISVQSNPTEALLPIVNQAITDGVLDLGSSNYRFHTVYASNGVAQTSDRDKKSAINYDITVYDKLFDALRPSSYLLNGDSRTHIGLIAQDVEQALSDCNMTYTDFAGIEKLNDTYNLYYSELHGLEIAQIQKLKSEIAELKAKIAKLENL